MKITSIIVYIKNSQYITTTKVTLSESVDLGRRLRNETAPVKLL